MTETASKVGFPPIYRPTYGRVEPKSSIDHPRPAFSTTPRSDLLLGHLPKVSAKAYAEYTLPHPLLRTRSPFALPARDYTPSTQRVSQQYAARALTYDVDGSMTGPVFASHNKGWGVPPKTGYAERPAPLSPPHKHTSDNGRQRSGLYTTWPELNKSMSRPSSTRLSVMQQPPPSWATSTFASLRN